MSCAAPWDVHRGDALSSKRGQDCAVPAETFGPKYCQAERASQLRDGTFARARRCERGVRFAGDVEPLSRRSRAGRTIVRVLPHERSLLEKDPAKNEGRANERASKGPPGKARENNGNRARENSGKENSKESNHRQQLHTPVPDSAAESPPVIGRQEVVAIALVGLLLIAIVAVLYFAKAFFLPVVMAFLVGTMLSPAAALLAPVKVPR